MRLRRLGAIRKLLDLSKLDDARQDNRTTRANQWVIGLGLAALIVTIVSIFPVFFDWGSKIRDLVDKEVHSTQTTKSVELPRNENEISGGKKEVARLRSE